MSSALNFQNLNWSLAIDENLIINIRSLKISDAQNHFNIVIQEKVDLSQSMSWPQNINNFEDSQEYLKQLTKSMKNLKSIGLGLFHDQTLIGIIGFNQITQMQSAELSYWIILQYRQKHIIKKASRLLINWAFEYLKLQVIFCAIPHNNLNSCRLAESLNMKLEGRVQNAEKINDIFVDHYVYALKSNR